jgi:hypothetical protein
MEKRPWQITLRGLIWATFWAAVCFGSLVELAREITIGGDYPLGLPVIWLAVASPFIAIGVLFGKTKLGVRVGIGLALAVTVATMIRWLADQ